MIKMMFLALIPHRDARLQARKWSGSLFNAGFGGAYSFPWASPLALLSRHLTAGELKHCAGLLREESPRLNNGKISAGKAASIVLCENTQAGHPVILGQSLDLVFSDCAMSPGAAEKVKCLFPPLIGSCLLLPGDSVPADALPQPPKISFRAAALANMSLSYAPALNGSSVFSKWKIGKLYWLPSTSTTKLQYSS